MADSIVSLRIPSSLIKELKDLAKKNHYMDVSEEVRSILREKWLMFTNPMLHELIKVRKDIQHELEKKSMKKEQKEVLEELRRIKEYLRENKI